MKLNLLFKNNDVRAGYKNIDPYPVKATNQTFSEEKILGDIKNISWVCEDDGADEIIINNILPYIGWEEYNQCFAHWMQKLKVGGILTIISPEIRLICKGFAAGNLEYADFCDMVFGNLKPSSQKRGQFTLDLASNLLKSNGFKVLESRIINYIFSISAEKRPYVEQFIS